MTNLGPIEVSSIFQNNFIDTSKKGKVVVAENKLTWITEDDINKTKESEMISSLKKIVEIVRNIKLENIKPEGLKKDEYGNYIQNLNWLNGKIHRHNETINNNLFTRSIDAILSFFTAGHFKLSYQTLDDQIQRESNRFLLTLNDDDLLKTYTGKSFLKENQLEGMTEKNRLLLTKDQENLLERLFLLGHTETLLDVQNNSALRQLISDKLKQRPDFSDPNSYVSLAVKALQEITNLKRFIPTDNLLKILLFVCKNRELMSAGSIGVAARSRPHVRKFKASPELPVDIEYDTTKGDIIVKLGPLGKGSFKVVKKQLSLFLMQMQAIGKQEKGEVSEQELKMMQAAKGLPHVAQLHEAQDYYSVSKARQNIAMVLPLYNMGELEDNLKKGKLSDLNKLQIAADMIKGLIGLQKRGIIHRDIKPANIFLEKVVENGQEVVHGIVADLGLACFKENDPARDHASGSPTYVPPEIWTGSPADFSTDAWSVGVTLSEIFNGTHPMQSALTTSDIYHIGLRLGDTVQNPEPKDKNSIQYVIWKLLQPDLSKRMTLQQALVIVEKRLNAAKKQQGLPVV